MSSAKRLAREILDTRRLALGHATSPQLTSSALDGGQLGITDGEGNRVGSLGLGDDGGFVIDYTGGPKPPKPSPPTVTADAGIFRIEWDGSFVNEGDDGVLATSDTDRVEIHASMDENFVPDRVESFGGAFATLDGGSFTLGPLPEAGTYYFRLVARSKSAQFSEPSDRVEQELAITSIDLEITDAWLTGEAAQNTADGKNSIWRGPEEPEADPDRPFKDGDIWFEMVDGKSIPNIWDETAGAWVANDDYRQSEIERVQQELREELDTIVVDGSGTKNFYTPDMPTEGMREGDLWFDSSDSNKPYIYQDGEWITVQSSFDSPGAGEIVASASDEGFYDNAVTSTPDLAPTPEDESRFEYSGTATGTVSVIFPALGAADPSDLSMVFDGTEASKTGLGLLADIALYVDSPGGAPTFESVFLVDLPSMGEIQPLVINIPVSEGSGGYSGATHHVTKVDDDTATALDLYLRRGLASRIAFGIRVTFPAVAGAWVKMMGLKVSQTLGGDGIVDGAITETKVSDDAISTPKLQAGAIVAGKIAANAIETDHLKSKVITGEKLAVGAITAESGIIGSINAGTITVGEMEGARIKGHTVTADKLLVGGDRNWLPNGDLSAGDASGWPAPSSGAGPVYSATDKPEGLPGSVAYKTLYTARGESFGRFPVAGATSLTFSVWVKADKPGSVVYIEVRDQDDGHARRSGYGWSGDTTADSYPIGRMEVPTTWTKWTSTMRLHPEVSEVYIGGMYFNHSAGSERDATISYAGMSLSPMIGGTLIEGGAISTEHIRAGAITAESGIIGSIDANVITVGKIMGNQLDADAINGKTITGAKIRTASSGSRVELTHNGLKQYNSLGATIVDMTSGSFTLQGGSITGSTIKTATSGSRVEINTQGLKQYNSSNEVIAEMVGGSMVMTGVLEAENNVGQFQAGMAFPDGSSTSPGLRWNNIGGTGTWGGIATTNTSRGPGLAMQGPGGTGKYAYVDLSIERAAVRANSTSTRYAYLNMDPAAGEGINLTRSTSANGGSWVTMKDDVSVFTWHGSDANQTTYLNMRANAYDLRAYGASGDLVSGLWADTSATTLSAYKRNLELWGRRVQSMSIYNTTGVASASVYINASTGSLGRNTSSARYKQDIEAAEPLERLLDVETRYWRDRNAVAQYAEAQAYLKEIGEGPLPCSLSETPDEPGFEFGAIAEEVDGLGLSDLVVYDAFGRPDALHYEKFGIALIPIVRSLRDRIEELEAQLESA